MTKQFCELCAADVTDKRTGALSGIDDADDDGSGTSTDFYEHLCMKCYRAWKAWMVARKSTGQPVRRRV